MWFLLVNMRKGLLVDSYQYQTCNLRRGLGKTQVLSDGLVGIAIHCKTLVLRFGPMSTSSDAQ